MPTTIPSKFFFNIEELNKPERLTNELRPVAPDMNDANEKIDEIIRFLKGYFADNALPSVAITQW
jgi:hypothetical protein